MIDFSSGAKRVSLARAAARGIVLLALLVVAGMAGGATSGEAVSVPVTPGRIRVDVQLYMPGSIPTGIGEPLKVARELADEWEHLHPNRKIQFEQLIQTGTSEGEFLTTQLMGGIAPEIINANAEIAWPSVDKGWFVPLDEFLERPNPYVEGRPRWIDTFSNQALAGAKRAPDGKLYCIPIDIVETGIFYNKTLLGSLGITAMPETWDEMLVMMRQIQEAGLTPMSSPNNLGSDWGQDILFEMLYHDLMPQLDVVPSRPDAEGYLGHYLEPAEAGFLFTKGFFTRRDPRWRELYRLLKEWRGYWAKELKNSDPVRLFLTQRMALYWEGSWFIRRMVIDPYVDFDWGIAYIPTLTKASSRYASGQPATVVGGAAIQLHVTNSAVLNNNLEDCIDFLMYLSAPQNIERLCSEALLFIPNIRGARMDERLAPFQAIFQRHYCAIKWLESLDGKYKKYWRRMLDYYLNDGVDLAGFLAMLEANFAGWVESHRSEAGWDFGAMEKVWQEREALLVRELEARP